MRLAAGMLATVSFVAALADSRAFAALSPFDEFEYEAKQARRSFGTVTLEMHKVERASRRGDCRSLLRYPVLTSMVGGNPPRAVNARIAEFATLFDREVEFAPPGFPPRAHGEVVALDSSALERCSADRHAATLQMARYLQGADRSSLHDATFDSQALTTVTFARGGFASVRRIAATVYLPGAHPNSSHATMLVDLRTGKSYGFFALFRRDACSVAALDALVGLKLSKVFAGELAGDVRNHHLYGLSSGAPAGYDADVTPAGVVIANIFYSHAAASVTVEISRAELARAGVIRSDGPLRALLEAR